MPTILPQDSDNHPIPALRLKNAGAHVVSAGASSTTNAGAFDDDTRVISVYSSVPVYIAFGDAGVSATNADHYFPADVYYNFSIGGGRVGHSAHVAVLAVSDVGNVYISEME